MAVTSTDLLMIERGGTLYKAPVSELPSGGGGADGDGAGTVTSVATGAGLTGGPISSSGTVALDSASIASLDLANSATQPGDLGTAAPLDVAAAGDAASGEVVKGDDTRLTDDRDPTAHNHTLANITDAGTAAAAATGDFAAASHTHTIANVTDLQTALDGKATADQGTLADNALPASSLPAVATAAQVRSLTTANTMTPEKVLDALVATAPSGGSNFAPDWASFIASTWVVTANRVLSNPTNVIPGSTRSVTVKASTSTERTITFGNQYKGDLPTVAVTNAAFVTLFLYAVSATEILVSDKEWA